MGLTGLMAWNGGILLLYYYGAAEKYTKQRKGLIEIVNEKFKGVPETNRRRSAELVLLTLDLMACPFLNHDDRRQMCQYMNIDDQPQTEIEKYLKKRKFMFTRWTNVNLTKELGAKVSLQVYG